MCNLYRLSKSVDEVADFFRAIAEGEHVAPGANFPEETYPGYPGLVLAYGVFRTMTWGFPLSRKSATGQPLKPRPVNNARSDKLASPFWSASFHNRRCLIPLSAFAEAEGPKGGKTRTWFDLPDQPMMAVAGFWRDTAEWGEACTMVMTEACENVQCVHDRMPVILSPDDWSRYLSGTTKEAMALCRPYAGAMTVNRTDTPWTGSR